jgi:hypothetical protein
VTLRDLFGMVAFSCAIALLTTFVFPMLFAALGEGG